MKILVTGNMGYVGPGVVAQMRASYPQAVLAGYDIGFFASNLTNATILPECLVDQQNFADVRTIPVQLLEGVDAVVHLAAISNDPMGDKYEEVTLDINYRASVELARKAKQAGVNSFVFASSCSVYGFAEEGARSEQSQVNPLTAYARSKVFTERDLQEVADGDFKVTCLRFATACGMSPRLRLDLVLNDFVAGAISSGKISILSDGTPWRPLINVKDMARAIDWAIARQPSAGGDYLVVNAGTDSWNYQVKELAEAVARVIPGVEVSVNRDAQPDKRSYKVNFDLFRSLAPDHQPLYDLPTTISDLQSGLQAMEFADRDFRNSTFVRLKVLESLRDAGVVTEQLGWAFKQ
ncbi:MAG TPA: SDR family oxidoreductase [Geobacteraceae bacterium]